jgi:hypothetical protein
MNVAQFIAKWERVELTESSAAQQHFLDLCEVVEHPKPAARIPRGSRSRATEEDSKQGSL